MGRGLDVFYTSGRSFSFGSAIEPERPACSFQAMPATAGAQDCASRRFLTISVAIARGIHLFPFRTEPLSLSAPMVLGGKPPGRVGRRQFFIEPPFGAALSLSEA